MPVITVSGSLASGAREVAQAVASDLHLDYVDHEILTAAAHELGVSVTAMEKHDERRSTFGERIASVMRTLMERSAAAGTADPLAGGGLETVLGRSYGEAAELAAAQPGQLDDESYIRTLTSVITGIAARGNVVILGRGSQAILQHQPETLHVWVAAPRDWRIKNLMQRDGITEQEADKRITKSDKDRDAFHRSYFKVEPNTPALYDLGFNAARISIASASKMVALAASELTPHPG
jgi:cytidylate kinase